MCIFNRNEDHPLLVTYRLVMRFGTETNTDMKSIFGHYFVRLYLFACRRKHLCSQS